MRLEAVVLPELGTRSDQPIVVGHWHARPGDLVAEGDRLVEALVGPAVVAVAAPAGGRLAEVRALEDDLVQPGTVLGYVAIREDGGGHPPTPDARP